jgi:hypothetical protein
MFIKKIYLVGIAASFFAHPLYAEDSDPIVEVSARQQTEKIEPLSDYIALGEVEVWSDSFAQKMGTQKIDNETILKMPTSNGTVSELLKNNPNVQFSSNDSASSTQGEIAPENVSFHGERFYNNSWMIDGLSNNDNINPGSNNGSLSAVDGQAPYNLPDGGTQSFWINSEIIDSVDVYDSNISAKYGQFTGGVIDAKLLSPDTYESSGSISYRLTRDEWTSYHFESEEEESQFEKANRLYNQPQFTKQIYSTNINQPLSDSTAILFSYNRVESDIPFYHEYLDTWEDQKRLTETYLLKGLHEADNGDLWNLTFIHSPHESSYLYQDTKNGGYTIGGGGYRGNLDWEHFFSTGVVTTTVGYKNTTNSVDYEKNNFYAWQLTDSIDWQTTSSNAQEGGFGEMITEKNTITLKQNYQLDPLKFNDYQHKFSFGWKADVAEAQYNREQDTNIYTASGVLVPSICYDGDSTCIDGEQAADIRISYEAANIKVSNNHFSIYLQDQVKWNRLELTLGLRTDYDEFLDNVDIAPRFTGSYDFFGDSSTVVFGGVNRYFADSMLAYALSAKMGSATRFLRSNYDQGWVYDVDRTLGGTYLTNNLDTPYSDELNLGISQRVVNTEWTFKWVKRKGNKQLVRNTETNSSGYKFYSLSNGGESEADSYTLSGRLLSPYEWKNTLTTLTVGGNYMDVKSSFTSYDPGHLFSDSVYAYASGEVISVDEVLSRNSYSQPWTLFTTIDFSLLDWGVNLSQNYRYTAAYRSWESTGDIYNCTSGDAICGDTLGNVYVYHEIKYKERFVADWRFSYDLPIYKNNLSLSLDILNVFDSQIEGAGLEATTSNISYKPGRRFWLGARYRW